MGLRGINRSQTARNHDGFVVTALHTADFLLVFAEVAEQIRATKFVIERRAPEWAFDHDLQGAGDVFGLADCAAPEFGNAESGQSGFGFRTASGCAFIPNLAARARCRTGEGRNGGGVIVRFDFHQNMLQSVRFLVACCMDSMCISGGFGCRFGTKTLNL